MKSNSVYPYFWFGTSIRYLQDAKLGLGIHGDGKILFNIDRVFSNLEELDLQVTLRASYNLSEFRKELASTDADTQLNENQAEKLSSLVRDLRKTLEAEIDGFNVFVLMPKRIDVTKLMGNVPALLAPNVFMKLPDVARYDLWEAGKCIAFERPTAAAFHLLRATESVLRRFYCFHVRKDRVNLLWGPIIQNLRGKRKFQNKPVFEALFNNLDNIRVSFRNPTQHPEKIYDIQEVQDLWGLCVDVINRMAHDLPEPEVENIPF